MFFSWNIISGHKLDDFEPRQYLSFKDYRNMFSSLSTKIKKGNTNFITGNGNLIKNRSLIAPFFWYVAWELHNMKRHIFWLCTDSMLSMLFIHGEWDTNTVRTVSFLKRSLKTYSYILFFFWGNNLHCEWYLS